MIDLPDLSVEHLTVRFGGHIALNDVSLHAAPGTITGLIGPNGAGKTTTFNACTGYVSASGGTLRFGGRDLHHRGPPARAEMGLGRTFQRMELWDSMTVAENVALGPECFYSGQRPWGQLFGSRHQRRDIAARSGAAIERCDIAHLANRTVGNISTGQRRLVELARAMASPFRFLLLDEPSSGLDVHETDRFGEFLVDYVADTGVGILLVEHDMALVAAVCSYLYVLDFGRLIFSGTTADTLASEMVRGAYLGTEGITHPAVLDEAAANEANGVNTGA
jgi:ABC-type branched-subunit amino acid transport system ATPase component